MAAMRKLHRSARGGGQGPVWAGSGSWAYHCQGLFCPGSVEEIDVFAGLTVVRDWGETPLLHAGAGVGTNLASLRRF